MRYLAVLLLLIGTDAFAKEWTYRLKVVDEHYYGTLLGRDLSVEDLEDVARIREVKVVTAGDELPVPALSNELLSVCVDDCSDPAAAASPTSVNGDTVEFVYPVNTPEFRQANVFFHLQRGLAGFARLGFVPHLTAPIPVRIDRHIDDLLFKGEMSNNAFFDSTDGSLNFVPSGVVAGILGLLSPRFLDTAYDPTVIVHELTHLVLHSQIGEVENSDFWGIHEGVADFFALMLNETRLVGVIFGRGKPIREPEAKTYKIGMEAHDRGEVLLRALLGWHDRLGDLGMQSIPDTVFKALPCVKTNLFGSFAFFSHCLLNQTKDAYHLPAAVLAELETGFNQAGIFPDRYRKAPSVPPEALPSLGYVEYRLRVVDGDSEPKESFAKIEGGRMIDDFGWFVVRQRGDGEAHYGERSIVLIDMQTAQTLRAWDLDGVELNPMNRGEHPDAVRNAVSVQKRIESEFSLYRDMARDYSPFLMRKHEYDYEIDSHVIPAVDIEYKPWLNVLLRLLGMRVGIEKMQIVTAKDATAVIPPFTVLKTDVAFSFDFGDEKIDSERLRVATQEELISFEKTQPFTWAVPHGFTTTADGVIKLP
jgi:hypothetical protein